jgi:general secretion pathway protein G
MKTSMRFELNAVWKMPLVLVAAVAFVAPVMSSNMPEPLLAQVLRSPMDPAKLLQMKETVLKYALFQIRDEIDRFHERNGRYPASLTQLVTEGYLPQIPADPFTNRADSWRIVPPKSSPGDSDSTGVFDIMSGPEVTARDGTKYSTW